MPPAGSAIVQPGPDDFDGDPMIYLAASLTNVEEIYKVPLRNDCELIKRAVEETWFLSRREISVYDPISKTAPWEGRPAFTPAEIWKTNTAKIVVEADALMVHAARGASIGVGQEVDWAFDRGIPILVVHPEDDKVSKQVLGIPGFVEIIAFSDDDDLWRQVSAWIVRWRGRIEVGYQHRRSVELMFRPVSDALRAAWEDLVGRVGRQAPRVREIEAACRMKAEEIDDVLEHPLKFGFLPGAKQVLLGSALNVKVPAFLMAQVAQPELTSTERVALKEAQHENSWGDGFTLVIENVGRRQKANDASFVSRHDLSDSRGWEEVADLFIRGKIT